MLICKVRDTGFYFIGAQKLGVLVHFLQDCGSSFRTLGIRRERLRYDDSSQGRPQRS